MEGNSWTTREQKLAAAMVFCVSFVGTAANWLVATTAQTFPSMQNSFGLLMANQSTAAFVLCSLFAFYFSPMVFFNFTSFEPFSKRIGTVLLISYDICTLSHLFISLNRMCAICRPFHYNYYFNKHNTKIVITIIWVVTIIRGCISYLYFDCDFYYDSNILAFVFSKTKDCQFISLHVDFTKDLFIVITVGIVDAITITVVQITSRRMRKVRHDIETDKRRKREVNFLKQVVLQGILFSVELFTYFHLAWKYQNHWAVFAMTTLAWNLVHCGDALINVVFNAEFRKLIASPKTIFRKKHAISNHSATGPHAWTTSGNH